MGDMVIVESREIRMIKRYNKVGCGALLSLMASLSFAQGWQVPQPSPGLMPNPAQGKTLFLQNCASCHGADMKGGDKGDKKGPPLLHKIYEPSLFSNTS